jgi:hypothetical protein
MMLQMAMRGQLQGPGIRTKGLFILSLILLLVVCSVGEDKLSSVVAASAAFASPSIPPPPALSVPVWSLASPAIHTDGLSTSMNIVTFCTPVSVAPPKLWAVSLYTNTMTRDAFLNSKVAVLQLMQPDQAGLVPLLGKRSGYEPGFSKKDACQDHVSLNGNSCQWVSGLGIDTDSFIKPTEERCVQENFRSTAKPCTIFFMSCLHFSCESVLTIAHNIIWCCM